MGKGYPGTAVSANDKNGKIEYFLILIHYYLVDILTTFHEWLFE